MSRYELRGVLGRGGMAVVYEARRAMAGDVSMPVAVKCLRPDIRRDHEVWHRFAQEALLGFSVNNSHPNLVTIYDLIEDAEQNLWIVMDLVRGCTLRDLIRTGVPIPTEIVRRIVWELLAALEHVHGHSVLHRDISPDNVLLSVDGDVKLSDLGLAKLLQNGRGKSHAFRGKTAYASPEQLRSQSLDCRSDLYALGAMLYELLTGAPPYGDDPDPSRVLARMQHGPPPLRDSVPPDLRDLVHGVLQGPMDQRAPESAAQAMRFIERFQLPLATRAELGDLVTSVMRSHPQESATQKPPRPPKPDDRKPFTLTAHREPRAAGRDIWVWRGVAIMAALALLVALPRMFEAEPSRDGAHAVRATMTTAICEPTAEDASAMSVAAPSPSLQKPVMQPIGQPPPRPKRAARARRPATAEAPEPPWYEIPRVERTPWHIYLADGPADGPAEEPAEEKTP